jgi:hypothetical protein
MIVVFCPFCDREYQLADSLRGQVLTCLACQAPIRVEPPADDDEEPVLLESVPDEEANVTKDEPAPEKVKLKRFRKKRPKRPDGVGSAAADLVRYFLGAVGVFGYVLAGLFAVWLLLVAVTPLAPRLALAQITIGSVLQIAGWWWIVFVAFREDAWYGSLCVFTCLFAYVYVYMNLEGTWRPAGLMVLGLLMTISGNVLGIYYGVIRF